MYLNTQIESIEFGLRVSRLDLTRQRAGPPAEQASATSTLNGGTRRGHSCDLQPTVTHSTLDQGLCLDGRQRSRERMLAGGGAAPPRPTCSRHARDPRGCSVTQRRVYQMWTLDRQF